MVNADRYPILRGSLSKMNGDVRVNIADVSLWVNNSSNPLAPVVNGVAEFKCPVKAGDSVYLSMFRFNRSESLFEFVIVDKKSQVDSKRPITITP